MRHVHGPLPLAVVARVVPRLPVLPRGVLRRGAGLGAPLPVRLAREGLAGGRGPAGAVGVVGGALGRVGEDVVGEDDEAVALRAGGAREVRVGGRVRVAVWVVELCELVVARLGVGRVARDVEDVVGGRVRSRGPLGRGALGLARLTTPVEEALRVGEGRWWCGAASWADQGQRDRQWMPGEVVPQRHGRSAVEEEGGIRGGGLLGCYSSIIGFSHADYKDMKRRLRFEREGSDG